MERFSIKFDSSKLDGNRLTGTAHVYGTTTVRNGEQWKFAPGAFSKVLNNPTTDVAAFWNHNTDMPLGRQSAGTLTLSDDEDGLGFSIDLPDTTYANDLKVSIDRGDVNGMSFAMMPGKSTLSKSSNGMPVRTFTEVSELIEVSPVSLPAFAGTSLNRFSNSYVNESINSQITRAKHRVRTSK